MAGPAWLRLLYRPLSKMVFRPPWGVFEAATYGPAVLHESLSYPLPSTLAGSLAAAAYRRGLCGQHPAKPVDFEDISECVEALLGEGYALRAGLALAEAPGGGEVMLAYTGSGLAPLDELASGRACRALNVPKASYIGVALDRRLKTNLMLEGKGHIFKVSTLEPHAPLTGGYRLGGFLLLVKPGGGGAGLEGLDGEIVHLGGEAAYAGYAALEPSPADGNPLDASGGSLGVELVLLTPALIEEPPGSWPGGGAVLEDSLAEAVAEGILASSETEVKDCVRSLEAVSVPRNELQLEVVYPGWSTPAGMPRKPHVLVPPGTRLKAKLAGPHCTGVLAELGLGAHSRLGWGTALVRPAPQHGGDDA